MSSPTANDQKPHPSTTARRGNPSCPPTSIHTRHANRSRVAPRRVPVQKPPRTQTGQVAGPPALVCRDQNREHRHRTQHPACPPTQMEAQVRDSGQTVPDPVGPTKMPSQRMPRPLALQTTPTPPPHQTRLDRQHRPAHQSPVHQEKTRPSRRPQPHRRHPPTRQSLQTSTQKRTQIRRSPGTLTTSATEPTTFEALQTVKNPNRSDIHASFAVRLFAESLRERAWLLRIDKYPYWSKYRHFRTISRNPPPIDRLTPASMVRKLRDKGHVS